jgi:hypothetical protein
VISSEKLLARSEFLTTSVDTLEVINIVLPAAISIKKSRSMITSDSINSIYVLLGLVGVGETVVNRK